MCCATKMDRSATGTIPLGLIAGEAKRLLDRGLCQPVKHSPPATERREIVRKGLPDVEYRDPGCVWGDEGPVYDQ
jgi:hypothetical protein